MYEYERFDFVFDVRADATTEPQTSHVVINAREGLSSVCWSCVCSGATCLWAGNTARTPDYDSGSRKTHFFSISSCVSGDEGDDAEKNKNSSAKEEETRSENS